jgi:hypothetical protein
MCWPNRYSVRRTNRRSDREGARGHFLILLKKEKADY